MRAEYSHILRYLKFFVKSDTRPRPAPDAEPPPLRPLAPLPGFRRLEFGGQGFDDVHRLHRNLNHLLHQFDKTARVVKQLVGIVDNAGAVLGVLANAVAVHDPAQATLAVHDIFQRLARNARQSKVLVDPDFQDTLIFADHFQFLETVMLIVVWVEQDRTLLLQLVAGQFRVVHMQVAKFPPRFRESPEFWSFRYARQAFAKVVAVFALVGGMVKDAVHVIEDVIFLNPVIAVVLPVGDQRLIQDIVFHHISLGHLNLVKDTPLPFAVDFPIPPKREHLPVMH